MGSLVGFFTILYRETLRFLRVYRQTILPPLLSAFLFIFVFGYALGSRIATIKGITYSHFIFPGLAMMSVISSSYSNTSSSLYYGKLLRFLDDILIAPISSLETVLAFIIGGALRGIINGTIILLAGILFFGIKTTNLPLTFTIMVISALTFSSAGLIFGLFADTWEQVMMLMTFIINPLIYLGGVFYSIDMLPPVLHKFSLFNPLYYMINGIRYGVLGVYDSSPFFSFIFTLLLMLIIFSIAIFLFKKGYKIKS